jgi:Flp pilus assembly pilin Flp
VKQDQNFKNLKPTTLVKNRKGQAAVEYVLLLVVIVSMILAAKGLFSGVNKFIGDYVGDYFACLMDHGELPALGVSEADLKNHTNKCSAKFSIANGATLTGPGSSGGGGSSSKSKANQNAKSSNKSSSNSDSKSKLGSASNKDGSGNGAGGGSSGGKNSAYANGRIKRSNSPSTSDGPSEADNKSKIIEDEGAVSAFGRGDNNRNSNRSRFTQYKYKAITSGQMFDEVEKTSKREERKPSVKSLSKMSADEGFRPGPRTNNFVPPERKPAVASEDTDPNFGFGKMMKWLMIAGMVVAIVVFFGGQIMNYSNSE